MAAWKRADRRTQSASLLRSLEGEGKSKQRGNADHRCLKSRKTYDAATSPALLDALRADLVGQFQPEFAARPLQAGGVGAPSAASMMACASGDDAREMIVAAKTLRVDLVDVLGARWPRREPAALVDHLQPADRVRRCPAPCVSIARRSARPPAPSRLTCSGDKLPRAASSARRSPAHRCARTTGVAELARQLRVDLARIASGPRRHLRREQRRR